MMYLLDTNVLSEMRKGSHTHPGVHRWAASVDATGLYLSVISLFEMEVGIRRIERRDLRQGLILRSWLEARILPAFAGRILPIDNQIAVRCAALHVPDPRSFRGSLIAATAMVHDMTVVTRNTTDFKPCGVPLVNPWEY